MADESFENSNNLENLLSPFCYEPENSLPKTYPEVPGGLYLSGFISQDCTWGCCFNHSVVKCFPVDKYFEENQNGVGSHSSNSSVAISSASYQFAGGRITCATELAIHNQRTSSGARKLLLGVSYSVDNNNKELRGAVVIFDPLRCVPMKWIEVSDPVSSITVLSHFEEGGSNRPFFNETMMAMVGIAAVGLRGGSAIIVDLGLDDPNLSNNNLSNLKNISDITYRLLYVNPHEYVIATKRHKAVSKRSLIALKFSNEPEDEVGSDMFHYCKPTGESILMLHKNSVAVTCIEYVPVIGSLLLGFTCGGFQIWRVSNMELQYSSDPGLHGSLPVFGFSFQQPVDDPKNYCYVWVMYGNNSNECSSTHVELYCLNYESKTYLENFGPTYDGFKMCSRRMAFHLVDDFLPNDSENEDGIRGSARPLRIWSQPDSELMFCAWEVGRGGVLYVGAFDLNQWYSNHTKDYIVYNPITGLCPYWVALPIEIPDISNLVLDVRIIPKSLMRWENPHAKLDVHLYPSSISFRAVCLTNSGVSAFEHFGIQEKLIRIMLKDGPNLMIQPSNIKGSFLRYGLEPIFPQLYGEHLSDKDGDRFFIFSVLLESRRTAAIIRLASVWLDGSFANVGCTIDLIIDWISSYMTALRGIADDHWNNILTIADDILPPETVHFINFSNFAWTSLHRLLLTLMNPTEVYSARGLELEDIEFGLGKLVQYSAALLMMYKAKLLPENESPFLRNLTEFYQRRRAEAKLALEASPFIDNQYKKTHPLMIDHLMDTLLSGEDIREEWNTADGEQVYPPQHIGYLVNMFMWPDADPKAVSRVFMYFLFDMNYVLPYSNDMPNSDVERKVRGDFRAVVDTAAEESSEIYCLWLLDHGVYDEILIPLKEKDRLFESDGLPWCASTVALTAAGYENDIADLLLKSCPLQLARLLFCLMSSSVSKYDTLAELMVSSNLNADNELLVEFFEISEARGRLGEFIRKKSKDLPSGVRGSLVAFLTSLDSMKRLSQMLMYYVHTEDYQKLEEEFVKVRNVLRQRKLSDTERKTWTFQEKYISHLLTSARASIVERFLHLQSPQLVRPCKSTISIKAVICDSPISTDQFRNPSKVPPQVRRLKFSETISADPLSPLRRYAGKFQSAVSSIPEESESEGPVSDQRSRKFSRKSFLRRDSFNLTRMSVGISNNSVIEESGGINDTMTDDRQNRSGLGRSCFDLRSLLKTPSVDHRIENRLKKTGSLTINMSQNEPVGVGIRDETFSQSFHVQSIMKEKDPTKPKVLKKVELCLENLSLLSNDEDERNQSIYEDAGENFLEDSVNNFHSPTALSEPKSDLESSSTEDKTLLDNESESELSSPLADQSSNVSNLEKEASQHQLTGVCREIQGISSIECEVLADSISPDTHKEVQLSPDVKRVDDTQDEFEISVIGQTNALTPPLPTADKSDIEPEQIQEVILESPTDEIAENLNEELDVSNVATKIGEVDSLLVIDEHKESEFEDLHQDLELSVPSTEISKDLIEASKVTRRNLRGSRSRTPTRESELAQEDLSNIIHEVLPKSRGKTPTCENVTAPETIEDNLPQRNLRRSRSKTPSRKSSEVLENLGSRDSKETTVHKTRSKAVPREASEEPDAKRIRRSSRVSRSMTPTRELNEESEPETTRRNTRISRSRTPTRDTGLPDDDAVGKSMSTRKNDRRTPSREVDESDEGSSNKPVRRSTRTSLSRVSEVYEEEFENELESTTIRRSTRVSRSRTPTRDHSEEASTEPEKKLNRRTTRSTRSTTPTRDIAPSDSNLNETEQLSLRRTTRSTRSKTPTRDLEDMLEEPTLKPVRRSTRSSKTPTRELAEESLDESDSKPTRRSGRTPQSKQSQSQSSFVFETTNDDNVDEDAIESQSSQKSMKLDKPSKAIKRRLKYFDHHQDLSTLIEDPTTADASVFEATLLPSISEAPVRRIKGIRARTEEEESEPELTKPNKRRKATVKDDTLSEVGSEVSSRSNRSTTSSKTSSSSAKGKGSRRRKATSSQ